MKVHLIALAILAVGCPLPALADSVPWWQKQTTDQGCFLYQFDESISGMESDPQPTGYVWSGTCMPGQPISGKGTLYAQVDSLHGSERYRYIDSTTGRLVNGYFEGPVERRRHEVDAQGRWNPAVDQTGPAPSEVVEYRGSCIASLLDDEYSDYSECTPGRVDDPIVIPRVAPAYFPLPGAYAGVGDSTAPPTGPQGTPSPPAPAPPLADQAGATTRQPAPPQPALARIDPGPNARNGLWSTVPTRTTPASGTRVLADSADPAKRAIRQQQVAERNARSEQQRREREARSGTGSALLGALLQTAAVVAVAQSSPDAALALSSLAQSSNTDEANRRLVAGAVTALAGADSQQVGQALAGQAITPAYPSSPAYPNSPATAGNNAPRQQAADDGFSYTYIDGRCVGYGCPARAGTEQGQSFDPSRQRRVHNPAADATPCVQLSIGNPSGRNSAVSQGKWFYNNCGAPVEIFWCDVDRGECDRSTSGTVTVGAGRGWPAMTSGDIRWAACRGANSGSFDRGSQGTRYTCWNFD